MRPRLWRIDRQIAAHQNQIAVLEQYQATLAARAAGNAQLPGMAPQAVVDPVTGEVKPVAPPLQPGEHGAAPGETPASPAASEPAATLQPHLVVDKDGSTHIEFTKTEQIDPPQPPA